MTELVLPPLFHDEPASGSAMEHAQMRAMQGCDAGLLAHHIGSDAIDAALVFAPEIPLAKAMAMFPLCGIGFQNALGALAPPEVAVHLEWNGGLRINGAKCGSFSAACSHSGPDEIPDWLAVGFTLPLWPKSDRPGDTPDETALYAEGCADVQAPALVEAWARHTLGWIGRWEDEGNKPLHTEWRGLVHGVGEPANHAKASGTFLGVDEDFGMLLRDESTTHLIPLTALLESS